MKIKYLMAIAAIILAFNMVFVGSSLAALYVHPAKLGILRLTVSQFFPAKATGEFEVGNTYNFSLNVNITSSKEVADIISLSENSFSLQPNETRTIDYVVTVSEPGTYQGYVQITTRAAGSRAWVGYQADIAVVASKSNLDLITLIAVLIIAAASVSALVYFKKIRKKGKSKMHIFATMMFSFAFLVFFSSNVFAADVVMAVKDSTSLSPEHEQPVFNILTEIGHNVTLVDQSIDVNYYDYDLIVVAGRPLTSSGLDDFVGNIPVNNIPTIGIDYAFLDNWGWVGFGGRSSYGTSQTLQVHVRSYHPITQGFSAGDILNARTVTGYTAVDMVKGGTNFTFVGTADADGNLGLVTYAPPRTQLAGSNRIADDSAAIFIGVNYPVYWSSQMIQIFKNSVDWLLNLEYDPPTVPVLNGPSSAISSATYNWTASSDVSGIQYYQFQLSKVSDFSSTVVDNYITGLQYTATGLKDGNRYYARVRAIDNVGVPSDWSNVVSTIVDFSNIILKINSPTEGTVLHLNDTVQVDVDVVETKIPDGNDCTITIGTGFIANLVYDKSEKKCSGSVTIPTTLGGEAIGVKSFTVSATNSVGSTNSSSVAIFMDRPFSVSVSTNQNSYNAGDSVTFSGYVTLNDNGAKVTDVSIAYSVSGMTGTKKTDSNGFYTFSLSNFAAGSHTATVNATYQSFSANNSVQFSVISSSQSSSSNIGGTMILTPLIALDSPDKITVFEDSDYDFFVRISNKGVSNINTVKLTVTGIAADVLPTMADIPTNRYQDFTVTLHIPEGVGEQQVTVKALAYGITKTKKINVTILHQVIIPDLRIIDFQFPGFTEGEQTTANITVENLGNATADVTTSISLPLNWTAEEFTKTLAIVPQDQEKISFYVTPSSESGNISFNVSYLADDQQKQLSLTDTVTVTPRSSSSIPLTGMITSFIASPEFYIPATFAMLFASTYFMSKKFFVRTPAKTYENDGNNFKNYPRRKVNLAKEYVEWERKHKMR